MKPRRPRVVSNVSWSVKNIKEVTKGSGEKKKIRRPGDFSITYLFNPKKSPSSNLHISFFFFDQKIRTTIIFAEMVSAKQTIS